MLKNNEHLINEHLITVYESLLVLRYLRIRNHEVQYYALLNLDRA